MKKVSRDSHETRASVKVATMCVRFFLLLMFTLSLVGTGPAFAQPVRPRSEEQFVPPQPPAVPSFPEEERGENWSPRFRRRPLGRGMGPQAREEQRHRLERGREMAQRLLENPNTPDEIKAKARRLTELLGKREGFEHNLDSKRQDFVREHGQDLTELRQLRERGEVIRQRLRLAREKVLSDSLPAIQEMRRTAQEARDIAFELRHYYQQRRRGSGRPAPKPEE